MNKPRFLRIPKLFCFNTRTRATSRIASNSLSFDLNLVTQQPEILASHLKSRRCDSTIVQKLNLISQLRTQKNQLIGKGDSAKSSRNALSQEIGKLLKSKGCLSKVEELKKKVEEESQVSAMCDTEIIQLDEKISEFVSFLPNLLEDSVPEGDSDEDNQVMHIWGEDRRKLGDGFKWHDEIGVNLGGFNAEAASRMSGTRFSVLMGPLARLERALMNFFLDRHVSQGYCEVSVPFIVSRSSLHGTGQLPKFEEDLFRVQHSVAGEDAFLIPTAEVPVTNLYRDQIIPTPSLPIKHVCLSPSFRSEAGSSGRDTRGLLRQHQFHKVELVKVTTPESSSQEHESMVRDAEAILEALELPYRRVKLCSGDTGFSARLCYDLEVWLPGQQKYREISSVSNCFDFQARRLNLRYRPSVGATIDKEKKDSKSNKKTVHLHTLNGSGVAVGRALLAVLENHQLPDGGVAIPAVLRPYMGGIETLQPISN